MKYIESELLVRKKKDDKIKKGNTIIGEHVTLKSFESEERNKKGM